MEIKERMLRLSEEIKNDNLSEQRISEIKNELEDIKSDSDSTKGIVDNGEDETPKGTGEDKVIERAKSGFSIYADYTKPTNLNLKRLIR